MTTGERQRASDQAIGHLQPIKLRGVRVHNLKNLNVDLPRNCLTAVCGVSGSGKTSLAIDTLYAEGQRRYIESFSAYTRQFLERFDKPDFDSIEHLPPAIAVTRSGAPRTNRATIGSTSETLDYLRLLYANGAQLLCTHCGRKVVAYTPQDGAQLIASLPRQQKVMVAFEVRWKDVGERASVLAELQASGFIRLVCCGQTLNLTDDRQVLAAQLSTSAASWVVVDRLSGGDESGRAYESIETAFQWGQGNAALLAEKLLDESDSNSSNSKPQEFDDLQLQHTPLSRAHWESASEINIDGRRWQLLELSEHLTCRVCKVDYPHPEPRLFSFNSPMGACPTCEGFGDTQELDMNAIIPNPSKTIRQGAIAPWSTPAYQHHLSELVEKAAQLRIDLDKPVGKLSSRQLGIILEGSPKHDYGGLAGFFAGLERKKYKMHIRVFLSRWRKYRTCQTCHGRRLNSVALGFRIGGLNLAELCALEIDQAVEALSTLKANAVSQRPIDGLLVEVLSRLRYLQQVGLGYLSLDRTLRTLSGGEVQRTALTATLGSNLVNMLYVLDEPSAGLHPYDVRRLAKAIEELVNRGNTVVMIEHELELIESADWIVELGPAAGELGGQISFAGNRGKFLDDANTLTAKCLLERKGWSSLSPRRSVQKGAVHLYGCRHNNLQGIDVEFPLGILNVVTGVSGSGKSSLVQETLYPAIVARMEGKSCDSQSLDSITGCELINECILVDQQPLARSSRSNPVIYVKAFDEIRELFAATTDAQIRNLSAGHFSFNSDLGRCPSCQGDGTLDVDMQFLADISITCPACHGKRFRQEILAIRYRDRNIADVLQMSVRSAIDFFRGAEKIQRKLQPLADVGLDYLQLGQATSTLSTGEGQRLRLAAYFAQPSSRKSLFIFDEPTTGLHPHDVSVLIACFNRLLSAGHSLVVVEHDLQVIAAADHIIDLGPGPAHKGGRIVACGTPEQIAGCGESATGHFIAQYLGS